MSACPRTTPETVASLTVLPVFASRTTICVRRSAAVAPVCCSAGRRISDRYRPSGLMTALPDDERLMALFIALWALSAYSVLSWSATAGLMDTAHWNLSVERSRLTTVVVMSPETAPFFPFSSDVIMLTVPTADDNGSLSMSLFEFRGAVASASCAVREEMTGSSLLSPMLHELMVSASVAVAASAVSRRSVEDMRGVRGCAALISVLR